jgi:hypothetical protein
MAFPSAPTQYQRYVDYDSKREWIWDGYKWSLVDKAFYQNRGDQGTIGPQGKQGNTGPIGVAGLQGKKGDDGEQGVPGTVGATGVRGKQGPEGGQGGAFCQLVIEPPNDAKIRGAMYLSSWNEVYVAIG